MNVFRRRPYRSLERALRRARPKPPEELVDRLAARATADGKELTVPRRPRLALAVAAISVIAIGAFGGVGYAGAVAKSVKTAAATVASFSSQDTGKVSRSDDRERRSHHRGRAAVHQYTEKVIVCLLNKQGQPKHTATVAATAAANLIEAGKAAAGSCPI